MGGRDGERQAERDEDGFTRRDGAMLDGGRVPLGAFPRDGA